MSHAEDLFRKNMLRLMKARSLTSIGVARKAGILPQNFSKYVKGHLTPSLSTLQRIASALDVSVADLLVESPLGLYFSKECATELFSEALRKFVVFDGLSKSESVQLLTLVQEFGGWRRLLEYLLEDKLLKRRSAANYVAVRESILNESDSQISSDEGIDRRAK